MTNIKMVKIDFKKPLNHVKEEVKQNKPNKNKSKKKFVTGVNLTPEGRESLRRVFTLVNRARHLAIRYIQETPDMTLDEFKSKVVNAVSSDNVSHLVYALINRELYHIHKGGAEKAKKTKAESKSLSFYEEKMINNRFTINYRRDKIVLEDLDILLELEKRLPRFDEDEHFFLHVCVDDLFKIDYVYINVFYHPAK